MLHVPVMGTGMELIVKVYRNNERTILYGIIFSLPTVCFCFNATISFFSLIKISYGFSKKSFKVVTQIVKKKYPQLEMFREFIWHSIETLVIFDLKKTQNEYVKTVI